MQKDRKLMPWTQIRSRLRSPKAVCHFLGKLEIPQKSTSIPAPFFCSFLLLFQHFPEKSQKRFRVPPQSLKKTPKWFQGCPNGAQGSQDGAPRSPSKQKKQQMCTKGAKMEPQVSQWCPKVPESAKLTQKGPPKCYWGTKLCCKVAKNTQDA